MIDSNGIQVAWVGVVSAMVGGALTLAGTVLTHVMQERSKRELDEPRRALLRRMLADDRFKWRRLDTLMHVIGADADTTKRLLIDIGARGSEDGQNLWGLIERNPLPSEQAARPRVGDGEPRP